MHLVNPALLWWMLAALPALAVLAVTLVDRPRGLRLASTLLRVAGLLLLAVALARPFVAQPQSRRQVVHLLDISRSVDLGAALAALDAIEREAQTLGPDDGWSLLLVGRDSERLDLAAARERLSRWQAQGVDDAAARGESRLAGALAACRSAFPAGCARQAVLWSDGVATDEGLPAALAALADDGIALRFEPIGAQTADEAGVISFAPAHPQAFEGEVVRFTTVCAANADLAGRLRILHRGVAVLDRPVALTAAAPLRIEADLPMLGAGPSTWTAELVPERDRYAVNNRLDATVEVRGKPRVLVLHRKPTLLRSWARALRQQEIEADLRGEHGLPESLADLLAFDAIVLAGLPATALTARQMAALKRYVTDFGGGLAMLGSDDSFGLGGYHRTPVEEVLPLTSRYEKEKDKPSLAMVMVIDKSGSMSGVPIELARQAAKAAVDLLGPRDQAAVVAFDHEARVICDLRSGVEKDAIQQAIDSLDAGGGTFLHPGMQTARDLLDGAGTRLKHCIILSDGMSQEADHLGLAQAMADAGITVSTVALGDGCDRALLSRLAEVGRGRYYETTDPATVPQIFTKETIEASKSAVKEDIFVPAVAGSHPLLSGVDEVPVVLGYVMTEAKATSQVLLTLPTGDPLLAVGRYGLGQGLAWTSDLTERWGGEWLAWSGCGRFWAQALRSILRRDDGTGITVAQRVVDDTWRLDLARHDLAGRPVAGVAWNAALVDGAGNAQAVPVEEVGLGRYAARIDLAGHDRLVLRLMDAERGSRRLLTWSRPFPAEYLLSRRIDPALAARRGITAAAAPGTLPRPWAWAFIAAGLACVMLGILLRRV